MSVNKIDRAELEKSLYREFASPVDVHLFNELESTNEWLTKAAGGHPDFPDSVCVASTQTAGVGRRGKQWLSSPQSITFSVAKVINLPPSRLMGLSLVAGIAVTDVLREYFDGAFSLKWPNDVMLAGKKLGGILIDVHHQVDAATTTVTGVGMNIARSTDLGAVDQPYATLEDIGIALPSRGELTGRLAGAILKEYANFEASGWAAFASRWRERDYLCGKTISVTGSAEVSSGIVQGVGASGCLRVKSSDRIHELYSAEVSVRKMDGRSA